MDKTKHTQKIFGALEAIYSKVGRSTLDVKSTEALRTYVERIVEGITSITTDSIVEKVKKVDTALKNAFIKVGKDLEKVEKGLDDVNRSVSESEDRVMVEVNRLSEALADLEERMNGLEGETPNE